jgi:GxxExxY protein
VGIDTAERQRLDALIRSVVGAAYEVSNTLGPGFLEKVYERALVKELALRDLPAETQVGYPVHYKGQRVGDYFADLVVDQRLIVELKCSESIAAEHMAQCINYLKASGLHMALLINFRNARVQWKRIVFEV